METWPGVVNRVLVEIVRRELDDEVVHRTVGALVHQPFGYLTTEETFAALEKALRTDATLNYAIGTPHSEWAIREFLSRLSPEQVISELVDITGLEWDDVALSPAEETRSN